MHGSPEQALDRAVSEQSREARAKAFAEFEDWSRVTSETSDIRDQVNDGLTVNLHFKKPQDARDFMMLAGDKLKRSLSRTRGKK